MSSTSSDFYIFTPWSLDLFIRVPSQLHGKHTILQPFRRTEPIVHPTFTFSPPGHWTYSFVCHLNSTESIQSCSHFGALNLLPSLSYQALIFTWVKWSILWLSVLPKETTSKQCHNIETGETRYFSEKPAPSGIWNRARQAVTLTKLRAINIEPRHSVKGDLSPLIWYK